MLYGILRRVADSQESRYMMVWLELSVVSIIRGFGKVKFLQKLKSFYGLYPLMLFLQKTIYAKESGKVILLVFSVIVRKLFLICFSNVRLRELFGWLLQNVLGHLICQQICNSAGAGVKLGVPLVKNITPGELLLYVGQYGSVGIKHVLKENLSIILLK